MRPSDLPPDGQIREHPLVLRLWEPLRRAVLTIRARKPEARPVEVANEAASTIFEDEAWKRVLYRQLGGPRQYTEREVFRWLCYVARHVWTRRHEGPIRVRLRVRRDEVSVTGIRAPRPERANQFYEQRLLNQS